MFETKDMNLAACFMVEAVRYVETKRDDLNSRRLVFVFDDNPEIQRIQAERANGTHVASTVAYDDCLRRLKSIIHSFPQ
jgi:hypothetical protein